MTSLLLDTHILVWWLLDAPELTPEMRALFENSGHDLVVSTASVWEIGIKQSIGKLTGFENLLSVLELGGAACLRFPPVTRIWRPNCPCITRILLTGC